MSILGTATTIVTTKADLAGTLMPPILHRRRLVRIFTSEDALRIAAKEYDANPTGATAAALYTRASPDPHTLCPAKIAHAILSTRQGASSLSDSNKLLIRCAWAGTAAFGSAGYDSTTGMTEPRAER